jgi:preprotein translocase subunit Sec63
VPDLDPFLVLGLPRDATPEQIESAYRRRAALSAEARASAASDDERARIEHQQLLLARAYELAAAQAVGHGATPRPEPARPPALVLSIALGIVGVAALVVAVSTGAHGLYTTVVVAGALSLLSALYWRHQLVIGWAERRSREE